LLVNDAAADLNYRTSYSGVPVDYMQCDAQAFAVGDEVIVKFDSLDKTTPEANWDLDNLSIIGFSQGPKQCPLGIGFVFVSPENIFDEIDDDVPEDWEPADGNPWSGKTYYDNPPLKIELQEDGSWGPTSTEQQEWTDYYVEEVVTYGIKSGIAFYFYPVTIYQDTSQFGESAANQFASIWWDDQIMGYNDGLDSDAVSRAGITGYSLIGGSPVQASSYITV